MRQGSRHHAVLHWLRAGLVLSAAIASAPLLAQSTQEELNSPGVFHINADAAHGRTTPVTGANVTIVIVDTGLLATHPEFTGRVLPGYNVFDGSQNAHDGNGHGTHVAGILGAGKDNLSSPGMFGVAYNVNLMPIRALNNFGFGTNSGISRGIQVAVNRRNSMAVPDAQKPFAMNLSLGSSSPSTQIETSLRNAVNSINGGMFIAAAAGNSGGANPDWPARYAREAWANGQIIAVGAVDANNVIASFSNRAGDTRNFFIVAPGVDVFSTYSAGGQATYDTLSGTSMATPYVTGAAALIKSGWPFLTARRIGELMLSTATDLGAPGVDEIYGHGLLNLERAGQPVGQLTVPTAGGSRLAVGGALTASAATGTALQSPSRAAQLRIVGFDDYGRDFPVDLGPLVRRAPAAGSALAPVLAAVDAADSRLTSRNGTTLRLTSRSEATRLALGQTEGEAGYALSAIDAAGREVFLGVSGMAGHAFGLAGELARRGEISVSSALANPYFSLAQHHMHSGFAVPVAGSIRVKLGMLASDSRVTDAQGVPLTTGRDQNMALAEVSGEVSSAVWSFGIGRLREENTVLGASHAGALGYAGSADTNVMNLGLAFSPGARVTLGAQYSLGYTGSAVNEAASLVSGYSTGRSKAFTAFASVRQAFATGDSLTLTVSQPMRMTSGTMQMLVPVGADPTSGAAITEARDVSLRPDGREIRADLLYIRPIDRSTKWFAGLGVRHQPDHDALASREVILSGGLRREF